MPGLEPIHLFVYGTLTDPERVTALTGKRFERVDATLSGFERINSPLGYPFILPRPGAIVRGILLLNVDPVSLAQLDAYEAEGDLYRRQAVVVTVADRQVSAMTYVGEGIRASVTWIAGRKTDCRQPAGLSDVSAPLRCRHAPLADEQ